MSQYNITLSTSEDKALSFAAVSQQDWMDNAIHDRCRIAIDEIAKICVEQCLANSIQIPGSKDAMVDLAFQNGWVITAAQRQAQAEAEAAARSQAAQTEGA
jgi:hypothetical protein